MSQAVDAQMHSSGQLAWPPEPELQGREAADRPFGGSLASGVYRHSRRDPEALALSGLGEALSYRQLARQASGLAQRLRQIPGWSCGEQPPRVGVLASRSTEACIAALAASWAGASYVPLGLKMPPERLAPLLSRCRLTALLTDTQGAQLLDAQVMAAAPAWIQRLGDPRGQALPSGIRWEAAQALAADPVQPPVPMGPLDCAYLIFTSGSTGVPKGVMIPMQAAQHYVRAMAQLLQLQPSDRVLDLFELGFDVSVHNLFCTWESGASLHLLPPARVMNAVGFVREHRLTVWNSVPSLVDLLRQVQALAPGAMPSLRLSSFGGEPLSADLVQSWRAAAPASAIYNLYGPTEATVTCLGQRMEDPLPLLPGRDLLAIGKPLAGCDAQVLGEGGRPAPAGQAGELAIAGVQLATGYLDAPELTAARFVERAGKRWYLTGDLALRDEAGRFHCLGRLDNQVKVRGHRVELEDIDAHLRQLVAAPAVTVAWPLSQGAAQALVGFVAGVPVDEALTLRALRRRLPAYMVPSRLVNLPQLPLNANGKVDRVALRQMLEAGEV